MTSLVTRLCVLALLTAVAVGAIHVYGQQSGGNASTNSDTADQSLKSSARVNPSTLAMEFSLPLISYPGRAGNSVPVNLSYSSKQWEVFSVDHRDEDFTVGGVRRINHYRSSYASFSPKASSGWTTSLNPPKIVKANHIFVELGEDTTNGFVSGSTDFGEVELPWETVDELGALGVGEGTSERCTYRIYAGQGLVCTTCTTTERSQWPGWLLISERSWCSAWFPGTTNPAPQPSPTPRLVRMMYLVKRVNVQMSDGSIVEFRKDDGVCDVRETPACFTNINGTYLSVDGSRMRFERRELQADETYKDVLYLPNGDRYIFSNGSEATERVDVNGNRLLFNAAQREWTDTLGRTIKNPFAPATIQTPLIEQTQTVTLPGMGVTNLQYQLIWKKLKRPECEADTNPSCGESVLENPADELHYVGSNTCSPMWSGQALAPALFTGTYGYDEESQVIHETKNLFCGSPHGATTFRFNPVVLAAVILPDGSRYEFRYNRYGEITKLLYPTGASERFVYGEIDPIGYMMDPPFDQVNRGVLERWVNDGTGDIQHWVYGNENVEVGSTTKKGVKSVAPDGSRTVRVLHRSISEGYGFEDTRSGMPLEERVYDADGNLKQRKLTKWFISGPLLGGYSAANRDPKPIGEVSIVFEGGKALATASTTEYDTNPEPKHFAHLNPKRVSTYHYLSVSVQDALNEEYDWFAAQFDQNGQISSISETDYSYDSQYLTRNIVSRPIESRILNPSSSGDVIAKTAYVYDEETYFDGGYTTTNWQDPGSFLRGNMTTTKTWVKETNTWLEAHTMYDNFGNVRKVWDVSGDVGKFVETQYDPVYKYAYPTKVITPAPDPMNTGRGTTETSSVESTYDLATGLPLTVTDDFGQITRSEYDLMLRPTRVFGENFTAPESETSYGVPNPATGEIPADQRFVRVRKQIDLVNWDEATTWFDALGRTIKTQAKDSQGDVFVETSYDFLGRVERVTNPYRLTDPVVYWSKTRYDAAGRAVESYAPAEFANLANAVSLGVTSFDLSTVTNYVGTVVTTTDASGRKGRSITNALGQLLRVDEPTGVTSDSEADLGPLANPHQPTIYKYSPQGKMVHVQQGEQNRYFLYDSLGRLLRVRQPEQEVNSALNTTQTVEGNSQWTAGFSYDIVGNVQRATDANGVNIINEYDRASRVIRRCFTKPNVSTTATTCVQIPSGDVSTDTPTVLNFYDGKGLTQQQTPNYAKGKLTKVENTISQTLYTQFDNFGRLIEMEQRTPVGTEPIGDATPRISKYIYNLSGALIEEEYPSGRKVKNEFESDGDLSRIFGTANPSATETTYANSFTYTPDGRIERLKLGNGLWENAKFNTRLQVTELALGHGPTAGDLWTLGYEYGELNTDGSVNAAKNTGNVAKQTLSFNGLANPFVQAYKYDSLSRITEARETSNGSQTWKQTFGYDRYGNRTAFTQDIGGQQLQINNLTLPTIDPNTNRFTASQGYTFDKNGNLIVDPVGGGRSFVFNGDNKQSEVRDAGGSLIGKYFYDGEARRIRKDTYSGGVVTETTIFVYSNGKLIAEYSTAPPPQNPTTNYTVTDQLGSPRVIVSALSEVTSRRDFMPFGEELAPDANNRTVGLKYGIGDNVRQKFTGYQKDDETGLDFAEARMYENRHGRFTAVDPLLGSGRSPNPQTFNRFIYVLNNPLAFIDPSGLQTTASKDDLRLGCRRNCDGTYNPQTNTVTGSSRNVIDETVEVLGRFFSDIFYDTFNSAAEAGETNFGKKDDGRSFYDSGNTLVKRSFFALGERNSQINEGLKAVDPFGIVQFNENALKFDFGLVSREEFFKSGGEFVFNTTTTFFTGGTSKAVRTGMGSFGDDALLKLPQFADNKSAFTHYAKHVKGIVFENGQAKLSPYGADMPMFGSQREYISAAQNFFTSSGSNFLTRTRNGDIMRFDTTTNFFGVQSQNGTIRTFFKPEDGIRYFRRQ